VTILFVLIIVLIDSQSVEFILGGSTEHEGGLKAENTIVPNADRCSKDTIGMGTIRDAQQLETTPTKETVRSKKAPVNPTPIATPVYVGNVCLPLQSPNRKIADNDYHS